MSESLAILNLDYKLFLLLEEAIVFTGRYFLLCLLRPTEGKINPLRVTLIEKRSCGCAVNTDPRVS